MDYLFIVTASLAVIFLLLAIYFWWKSKKFTRERFAFALLGYFMTSISSVMGLQFFSITSLKIFSKELDLMILFTNKTNVVNSELVLLPIIVLITISYFILYSIWKNWNGEISIVQHERQNNKISDSPKYVILDSLELLQDFYRDKKSTTPYFLLTSITCYEQPQEKTNIKSATLLSNKKKLTETRIVNVTSKSLGIVVINKNGDEGVKNLIMVDDSVPKKVTLTFLTLMEEQKSINLRCMENIEKIGPNDPPIPFVDFNQEIGNAELRFSHPLPKGSPVEITFSLAADGLLSIHGRDLTTNSEIDAEFLTERVLSREELEEKKEHNLGISVSS